ncbi:hypothetical protein [Burkholderia seminalis]|uniref:Uncharacterized protein n=2 Tax=Burkholderia cepacia complex TaxID=87882 RepID=A0A8A8D4E6_9BURK|nr:hypothetical protein [Burkholderia seminalis]QTO19596.1 hypothetical protein DT99_004960 [Burkholderia seminalis]
MANFQRDQSNLVDELTIVIEPHFGWASYIGTRMQLEAEGLIPEGTQWPDGFRWLYWQSNGLRFCLRRKRPEGAKGSRRAFFDCDNWCLRTQLEHYSYGEIQIRLKANELRKMLYRESDEGRRDSAEQLKAFWQTLKDKEFQEFKALIPGFISSQNQSGARRPVDDFQSPEVRHD